MGGILGDHNAHQNCVRRLARYFSRDSRYLPVRLRFGIKVNINVLASLYLVSFVIVGDMEFTTANIHIIRMAEHHKQGKSYLVILMNGQTGHCLQAV